MSQVIDRVLAPAKSGYVQTCSLKVGDLAVYRYDHPRYLPEAEKENMLQLLLPVAMSAFRQNYSASLCVDVKNHIFSSDRLLIVVDRDGKPVAFRMWDYVTLDFVGGTDIAYLAGMCVHQDWQKKGIGEYLLQYVLQDCVRRSLPDAHAFVPLPLAPYVALRTQNPVMKRCFDRATGFESYPRLDESTVPEDIKTVGRKISEHLRDHFFDPDTMLSKGLYGHNLYGYYPMVDDEKYRSLFARLDVDQGDAMVCVWRRYTKQ